MKKSIGAGGGPRGAAAIRRKAVGGSAEERVDVRPLFEDRPAPLLVTPHESGTPLAAWGREAAPFVQRLWEEHRAVLFRGFDMGGSEGFSEFVDAISDGDPLPYVDRSTPRETYGKNVYCTTIYPHEYRIRLHNEGSYWTAHPRKATFGCVTPPPVGGETPVGDVHAVHERIDPEIREEFVRRRWMLVRNYNEGLGLPWQEVFQTSDRAEVESYCRKNRIDLEWKDGDRLRTKQVREPVLNHPRTGEPLWHNHAAFFHITTRDEPLRSALMSEFEEEDLPYNTFYGDGGRIDPEVIAHLNEAYDAELVKFRWQKDDVHLIDNLRWAHAREPYEGDRLILVALTEAFVPGS